MWTLPDDGTRIRQAGRLAFQADAQLRSKSPSVVPCHWHELANLKSCAWVLNHDEADVDHSMRILGGTSYTSLSRSDRNVLIAYVFASHVEWPAAW